MPERTFSDKVFLTLKQTVARLDRLKAVNHLISDTDSDFTRNRKLPFPDVIMIILSMAGCPVREELAEKMSVSRRTVSRWETGPNMPDLDILIELSDLYEVDLREILSGERKSERMNEELKETVLQVADYSNEEKMRMLQRMHWLFIAGLLGFLTFLVITLLDLDQTSPYEGIGSFGLGIAFGMIILGVLFTSKYASKLREFKMKLLGKYKD